MTNRLIALNATRDPGFWKRARIQGLVQIGAYQDLQAARELAEVRAQQAEATSRANAAGRALVEAFGLLAAVHGLVHLMGMTEILCYESLTRTGYDPVDVTEAFLRIDRNDPDDTELQALIEEGWNYGTGGDPR